MLTPDVAAGWLRTLLRIGGGALLLALPCALLPTEWMADIHARLGLGTFPRGPIVEYLTRSACLLYAMHGAILLAVSRDVRRCAPVIAVLGGLSIAFGAGMGAVDAFAGMPAVWTIQEALGVSVMGALLLVLNRRASVTA